MISKKDLNIIKAVGKEKIFLEINNLDYDLFLSFENVRELESYLKKLPIENLNSVIKEVRSNLNN